MPNTAQESPPSPPAGEAMGAARWLPVSVAVGLITVALLIWRGLTQAEHAQIERATQSTLSIISYRITAETRARIEPLVRMARRMERYEEARKPEWESDAALYLSDYPSLQTIAWVDASFHLRWTATRDRRDAGKDLHLESEQWRRTAVDAARERREVVVGRNMALVHGGTGFVVLVPIPRANRPGGFLMAVFDTRSLLGTVLTNVASGYAIALFDGAEQVYSRSDNVGQRGLEWSKEIAIDLYDVPWRARVWPGPEVLAQERSPFPQAVLVFGVGLSLLMAAAVTLALMTRLRLRQSGAAKAMFQGLFDSRRQTEAARAIFEGLFDSAPDALVVADAEGRILHTSREVERAFGYSPAELRGQPVECLMPERFRRRHEHHRAGYVSEPSTRALDSGLELFGLRKDGSEFPVDIALSPLQTADGLVVLSAIRDISERKRAGRAAGSLTKGHSPEIARKVASMFDADSADVPHDALSDREHEVLCRLGAGKGVKQIAAELGLSSKTVSACRTRILEKMHLRTNAELIRHALFAQMRAAKVVGQAASIADMR